MTMPGDATIGEVARTLERFERTTNTRLSELATSLSLMVTRDLYDAHRAAMQDDINEVRAELKADRERKAADRRMVVSAFLAAALAVVVAVITTLFQIGA